MFLKTYFTFPPSGESLICGEGQAAEAILAQVRVGLRMVYARQDR